VTTSIRQQLLLWLTGALLLGAVLIALATYLFSLEEMNEVFDEQLRQVTLTVLAHYQGGVPATRPAATITLARGADEDLAGLDFVTQVWTLAGERVFMSRPDLPLPISRTEGFELVSTPGGNWRVYTDRSAGYFIQAAQSVEVRERLAADVALKILIPSLAAVPPLALLLLFALRRGLRPLTQTALEVGRRSAASLTPNELAPLPQEIRPLVASINVLMQKLEHAMAGQRRFTADAAHELRTPLTALRLQLQLLATAHDEATRKEALEDSQRGLARAAHLVEQLLQLSRLDPDAAPMQRSRVDLAALAKTVVADFSARADALGIDLGADVAPASGAGAGVLGDGEQLRILLNNLVDNALRHTPGAGRVDVRVQPGPRPNETTVEVADSGSGVAPAERERIFRRFYRGSGGRADDEGATTGAGLGLAIVAAVARRHQARVEVTSGLGGADGSEGLAVRVSFPAAPA
jgi:signal transduction histidine kinase